MNEYQKAYQTMFESKNVNEGRMSAGQQAVLSIGNAIEREMKIDKEAGVFDEPIKKKTKALNEASRTVLQLIKNLEDLKKYGLVI